MKEKKTSIKEIRKQDIMAMGDLITMKSVCAFLNIQPQTARLALVELENEEKLLKYGRGDNAIWKHV